MALFTAIGVAIGSIFSTFTAGGFFASAFGKFLVKTLARAATSFLVQAIMGGNKKPAFSVSGQLQSGEDTPRGAPLGVACTAGSLVYANEWGKAGKTTNAYFTQVIALSDMPIKGLLRVQVNGAWVTLLTPAHATMGFPVQEFRTGSTDYLWVKFYDGTQVAADTFLTATVSSVDRPYQSTRVGVGVAYAIVTSRLNEKLFNGFPTFKFEIDSIKLYDPSKDTTVGGVGTQRWATPSTWGGDGDYLPVVQAYNVLRGMTYGGNWQYGFQGMSAGRLPSAGAITQINACRALISTSISTTEQRFRSGGYLSFDTEVGSAVEAIMSACAGRISDNGGIYGFSVGLVSSTVASITDGDLISTEDSPFYPIKGLADTVNAVTAQYPDPVDGYALKDAPGIYRLDLEAVDSARRLPASVTFSNVPFPLQVQRLMALVIEEARRARRHTIPLPSDFWALEPNDIIEWTSERHGYVSKKFRINAVIDQADAGVACDIVEIDPADYDFDYADYVATTNAPAIISGAAAYALPGWAVTASTIRDGVAVDRRPALLMAWDSADIDGLTSISYEIRLAGGAVVKRGTIADVSANSAVISEGILPSTAYEARAYGNAIQATSWTAWVGATTLAILLNGQDVYDGALTRQFSGMSAGALALTSRSTYSAAYVTFPISFLPDRIVAGVVVNPIVARIEASYGNNQIMRTLVDFRLEGKLGAGAWTFIAGFGLEFQPDYPEEITSQGKTRLIIPSACNFDQVQLLAKLGGATYTPGGGVSVISARVVLTQENKG